MTRRGRRMMGDMLQHTASLDEPDRADCVRPRGECRSPRACASVQCCADSMSAPDESKAFGYGFRGGVYKGN